MQYLGIEIHQIDEDGTEFFRFSVGGWSWTAKTIGEARDTIRGYDREARGLPSLVAVIGHFEWFDLWSRAYTEAQDYGREMSADDPDAAEREFTGLCIDRVWSLIRKDGSALLDDILDMLEHDGDYLRALANIKRDSAYLEAAELVEGLK